MRSPILTALFSVFVVACTAPASSAPSRAPVATLAATVSPTHTPTPTSTTTATFAAVCGTISDFAGDNAQTNGSFVLNSPGRAPLKITIPADRLGGSASGFVISGAVPATTALPAPTGSYFRRCAPTSSSLAPGDYPRISQFARIISPCA